MLSHHTDSKMALASVLSDEAHYSSDYRQPFVRDQSDQLDDATPTDELNFLVKNPLSAEGEEGIERKIEFLHGTTTLAFKVSVRISVRKS